MARETLRAVHDDDLIGVLDRLGLRKDFERGALTCAFSDDVITWDNLHSIFPHGGTVKVSCDREECIARLVELYDPPALSAS